MALRVFSPISDEYPDLVNYKDKLVVIREDKSKAGPAKYIISAICDSLEEAEEIIKDSNFPEEVFNIETLKEVKRHNPNVKLVSGTQIKSNTKRASFRLFSDNKISSDGEFRDYAHNVMKQAHKDNYSKEITDKVVDDLLKNNPDADYGELVGRLTSGFGQ